MGPLESSRILAGGSNCPQLFGWRDGALHVEVIAAASGVWVDSHLAVYSHQLLVFTHDVSLRSRLAAELRKDKPQAEHVISNHAELEGTLGVHRGTRYSWPRIEVT